MISKAQIRENEKSPFMDTTFYRAVERLGFPIAISIALIFFQYQSTRFLQDQLLQLGSMEREKIVILSDIKRGIEDLKNEERRKNEKNDEEKERSNGRR